MPFSGLSYTVGRILNLWLIFLLLSGIVIDEVKTIKEMWCEKSASSVRQFGLRRGHTKIDFLMVVKKGKIV
jgi:hypothetical protein